MPELRFSEFEGDWISIKFEDVVVSLDSGVSVNSVDVPISAPGQVGVLKTSCVLNGKFFPNENKSIIDIDVKRAKLNPVVDSVIISRMNTPNLVGESGYVSKGYDNIFLPDRLWLGQVDMLKNNSKFFSLMLSSAKLRDILTNIATGTSNSMKNISKSSFLGISLPFPTLPEQTKIAEFLTAIDKRIELLTAKKEKLTLYKKGVMQKIFNQELRFKIDNGHGELVEPPEWEERRLGEVVIINPVSKDKLPNEFLYIDLESVVNGNLVKKSIISRDDAPSRAQRMLEIGDVIFQMVRPYQQNNYIFRKSLGKPVVASTGYAVLRSDTNSNFVYQLICNQSFTNEVINRCTGTSYPAINSKDLGGIIFNYPKSQSEINKIGQFLTSIDANILSLDNQITLNQTYKKGLLQKMFV